MSPSSRTFNARTCSRAASSARTCSCWASCEIQFSECQAHGGGPRTEPGAGRHGPGPCLRVEHASGDQR
jgi:hypothetical protein